MTLNKPTPQELIRSTVSVEVMDHFRARALELTFDLEDLILLNQTEGF